MPEYLGFCYQPISMPNNITRQNQRCIKDPVEVSTMKFFHKNS